MLELPLVICIVVAKRLFEKKFKKLVVITK